jgi:ABC-type dipeptide/oligopeptide/nickel transport system permease subunit
MAYCYRRTAQPQNLRPLRKNGPLQNGWQLAAAAAVGMVVFVTAFSLLTDALRDALDPKLL